MAARVAFLRSLPRQSYRQIGRQRPHARFNSSQATPPPAQKPGSWMLPVVGVGALIGAGGYYYYKQSGYADGIVPASEFPVAAGKKGAEQIAKPGDYQAVYNAIAASIEEGAEDYDDGSFGPVMVRLAWHASGTYDKETGTGGSNGATMVFSSPLSHEYTNCSDLPQNRTTEPMPVSRSPATISRKSSKGSHGSLTLIFGLLLVFVRFKKWAVLSFHGDPAVPTKI